MTIGGVQFDKDILDLAVELQRMKDDQEKRRQLAEKYPKYYAPLPEGNLNTFADYKAMVDYEVKRQLRCKVREQWYFEQGRIYQNLKQIQYITIQQINMFPSSFEHQLAQAHPNYLPFIPAYNFNSYPSNDQMFQMASSTLQNYEIPDNGVADVENELEEPEVSSPDENTEQFYPPLGHQVQPLPNSQPISQPHCNFCPSNNSLFPTSSSHQLYPEVPIDNQVERQQHFAIKQEQQDVFNRGCNMDQFDLETCSMNSPPLAVIKQERLSSSEDENNYPTFPVDSSSETVTEAVATQPFKIKQEHF